MIVLPISDPPNLLARPRKRIQQFDREPGPPPGFPRSRGSNRHSLRTRFASCSLSPARRASEPEAIPATAPRASTRTGTRIARSSAATRSSIRSRSSPRRAETGSPPNAGAAAPFRDRPPESALFKTRSRGASRTSSDASILLRLPVPHAPGGRHRPRGAGDQRSPPRAAWLETTLPDDVAACE